MAIISIMLIFTTCGVAKITRAHRHTRRDLSVAQEINDNQMEQMKKDTYTDNFNNNNKLISYLNRDVYSALELAHSSTKTKRSIQQNNDEESTESDVIITEPLKHPEPILKILRRFEEDKMKIIREESFLPLNEFLEKYESNIYNDLHINLQNNFIRLVDDIWKYENNRYATESKAKIMNELLKLKNEIDNTKWVNGIPPDTPWPRYDFPNFDESDNKTYNNINNINSGLPFPFNQNDNDIYNFILKDIRSLINRYINLVKETLNLNKNLIGNGSEINEYKCSEITKYIIDNKLMHDQKFGIGNHMYVVCSSLHTINSLKKLQAKLLPQVSYSGGIIYSSLSPVFNNSKFCLPIAKLYLYIAQHLYALDVIKIKFDGLDYTNPLQIKE